METESLPQINKSHKKWSKEDIGWLLNNYKSMKIEELSQFLKRSTKSVRHRMCLLKCLTPTFLNKIPWTKNEINYITNNYRDVSAPKMAKHLCRSVLSIYQKLTSLNFKYTKQNYKKWEEKEIQNLLSLYNENKSLQEMKKILGRSTLSLKVQLRKRFGFCRRGRNLKSHFKSPNFYQSMKTISTDLSARLECCICGYNLCIDLHHIDGNRKNNNINNIASLCPNHHREIEKGLNKDKQLFCIWWRIHKDGAVTEKFNNKKEILNNARKS